MKMSPPVRSEIWTFFKLDEHDHNKAQCKICYKMYSRKGRTSTPLKNHLKAMHAEEFELFERLNKEKQSQKIAADAEGSSKATKTQERAVVNDERMEMEIQIKVKDSPENSDVEESTLFEAEEVETQTLHTSKRNQNTTIDDTDDDENGSGEDSNTCVDPLIPASHLGKRNRGLIKTEDFTPDGGETQSQNTCQCGDEFRIYGEYVASQLKQLSIEESLLARDKIQSILTQSRLKDLKRKKNSQ